MEQINKTQISCMERDELHNDTVNRRPDRMYGKVNKDVEKGKWNSQSEIMFTIHPNKKGFAGLDIPITYFNEIRKGQATKGKWFTEIKLIKVKSRRRRVEYVIPMKQVNMELDRFAQRNGLDSLKVATIQNIFPKYAVCSNEGGTLSLEEVCGDRRWNCEISLAAHVKVKSSTRSVEDPGFEAGEDQSRILDAVNINYIALRNWFNGNLRVIFRNADCIQEEGRKKTKANLTGEEDDLLFLEAYRCMTRMLNSEYKEDEYEHKVVHTALLWIKESVEDLGYTPHRVLPYEYIWESAVAVNKSIFPLESVMKSAGTEVDTRMKTEEYLSMEAWFHDHMNTIHSHGMRLVEICTSRGYIANQAAYECMIDIVNNKWKNDTHTKETYVKALIGIKSAVEDLMRINAVKVNLEPQLVVTKPIKVNGYGNQLDEPLDLSLRDDDNDEGRSRDMVWSEPLTKRAKYTKWCNKDKSTGTARVNCTNHGNDPNGKREGQEQKLHNYNRENKADSARKRNKTEHDSEEDEEFTTQSHGTKYEVVLNSDEKNGLECDGRIDVKLEDLKQGHTENVTDFFNRCYDYVEKIAKMKTLKIGYSKKVQDKRRYKVESKVFRLFSKGLREEIKKECFRPDKNDTKALYKFLEEAIKEEENIKAAENGNSETENENSDTESENSDKENENSDMKNGKFDAKNGNVETENENSDIEVENNNSDIENGNLDVENGNSNIENKNSDTENEKSDMESENPDTGNETSDTENGNSDAGCGKIDIENGKSSAKYETSDSENEDLTVEDEVMDKEDGKKIGKLLSIITHIQKMLEEGETEIEKLKKDLIEEELIKEEKVERIEDENVHQKGKKVGNRRVEVLIKEAAELRDLSDQCKVLIKKRAVMREENSHWKEQKEEQEIMENESNCSNRAPHTEKGVEEEEFWKALDWREEYESNLHIADKSEGNPESTEIPYAGHEKESEPTMESSIIDWREAYEKSLDIDNTSGRNPESEEIPYATHSKEGEQIMESSRIERNSEVQNKDALEKPDVGNIHIINHEPGLRKRIRVGNAMRIEVLDEKLLNEGVELEKRLGDKHHFLRSLLTSSEQDRQEARAKYGEWSSEQSKQILEWYLNTLKGWLQIADPKKSFAREGGRTLSSAGEYKNYTLQWKSAGQADLEGTDV